MDDLALPESSASHRIDVRDRLDRVCLTSLDVRAPRRTPLGIVIHITPDT